MMRATALTLTLIVAASSVAHAEPSSTMQAIAERCYLLGVDAHARADYRVAVGMFRLADVFAPHPLMIYNEAQSWRLSGDLVRALEAYQRFLASSPTGPEAVAAQDWVAELSKTSPPMPPANDPGGTIVLPTMPPPPPPEVREVDRGGGLRVAGLVAMGVGAAALGVGTYYGLEARAASDTLSTPGTTFDPDLDAYGRRADTRFTIGMIAGGALVATGAGLYLFGRGRTERITVTPTVAGDGLSLGVAGVLP